MKVKKKLKGLRSAIKSSQRQLKDAIAAVTSASEELRRQLAELERVHRTHADKIDSGSSKKVTTRKRVTTRKQPEKSGQDPAVAGSLVRTNAL